MKKLLSMVTFVLLLSGIFISSASASTHNSHSHSDEESELGVLYVPCEVTGGKHKMTAQGMGQVLLTNGTRYEGNLYQCIACSTGVISKLQ